MTPHNHCHCNRYHRNAPPDDLPIDTRHFIIQGAHSNHTAANTSTAALLSEVFVVARVLHAVAYIANVDVLRSLIFLVAFACIIGLFVISA